jgi:hypothetical protein
MFSAYFDASGKRDQLIVVVAGFVSSAELWAEWEREWLKRLSVDGVSCFHATELKHHLTEYRRRVLFRDLETIIRAYVSAKAAVAVVNNQVDSIFSREEREEWRIHAYALAGRTVARQMRLWAGQWRGPLPELVFERGDDGAGQLQALLTKQGYPAAIFKPKRAFRDRKTGIIEQPAIPLQAGDLLAHEIFIRMRHYLKLGPDDRKAFVKDPASRIGVDLENIPGECGTIEEDRLRLVRQHLDEEDPQILVPAVKILTNP